MKYKVKDTNDISSNYGIEILKSRGIEDVDNFLHPTKTHSLQSWQDLEHILGGVGLITGALAKERPIFALVVDCDVDGFTSASILYQYLKDLKPAVQIDYYLHEGKQHGLSDTCDKIIDSGYKYDLCLVPDAGSNDFDYIERLKEYHIPTLVLDHHIVEDDTKFSDYGIIINNQMSPKYRNKDLSGAGVTY